MRHGHVVADRRLSFEHRRVLSCPQIGHYGRWPPMLNRRGSVLEPIGDEGLVVAAGSAATTSTGTGLWVTGWRCAGWW